MNRREVLMDEEKLQKIRTLFDKINDLSIMARKLIENKESVIYYCVRIERKIREIKEFNI